MNATAYAERAYVNNSNTTLLNMIPSHAARVLDIGCGDGANLRELTARGKTCVGVTISVREAMLVQQLGSQCVVADCEKAMPFEDGQFDAIILSHVVEHLPWPEQTLPKLLRLLRPNGAIYIAVPNVMFFRSRWSLILGRFPRDSVGVFDETHLRWFTWATPNELAVRAGMSISSQDGDAWFRDIPWLPKIVGRVLVSLAPNLCSQQIRFVLRARSAQPEPELSP
jgi:methionine biosynthesis protein MetW